MSLHFILLTKKYLSYFSSRVDLHGPASAGKLIFTRLAMLRENIYDKRRNSSLQILQSCIIMSCLITFF